MGLKFNCPSPKCRQRIEVEDALAGQEILCPVCATKVRVPASHDIRFNCRTADCGQHLVVDVSEAGRFVKCPACGKPQQVPGDPPKSAFPQPTISPARSRFANSAQTQKEATPSCWFAFLPVVVSKHISRLGAGMQEGFLPTAGTVLALLGMLKLWGWLGRASILDVNDPVIGINTGILMLGIGMIEIAVAAVCLLTGKERLAVALVAWLATNFVVYRAGLWWMGWQRPCGCLGYLSDALRISPQAADVLSLGLLAFLLVGSCGWLFWQWKGGRRLADGNAPELGGVK